MSERSAEVHQLLRPDAPLDRRIQDLQDLYHRWKEDPIFAAYSGCSYEGTLQDLFELDRGVTLNQLVFALLAHDDHAFAQLINAPPSWKNLIAGYLGALLAERNAHE